MWVERMRVYRFASFLDSETIEMSSGLNVIVGENHSGKSALLKCIDITIPNRPHVNSERYNIGDIGNSLVELDIRISPSEFLRKMSAYGGDVHFSVDNAGQNYVDLLKDRLSSKEDLLIRCSVTGGQNIVCRAPTISEYSTGGNAHLVFRMVNGELVLTATGSGSVDTAIAPLIAGDKSSIFNFSPQRFNLAKSNFSYSQRLTPNADNLPSFLSYLQASRPGIFEEIIGRLREVVNGIESVTVGANSDSLLQIRLQTERSTSREELMFGLETGGTGVSQVLAILAAVTSSDNSIIVIDEFNSFLHPSAAKKLLSICRTFYPQHQYIISTHSPEVITFEGVDQIFLVERSGYESIIKPLDSKGSHDRRDALRHLGVSMLDVLGFDHIIWVEGPTEKACFPLIMKRANNPLPQSVGIMGLASTGDFSRKSTTKANILKIYSTATKAISPLVSGSSFTLDRDNLTNAQVEDIEISTERRLLILPRRNIESFFLDYDSILSVINDNLIEEEIELDMLIAVFEELAGLPTYKAASNWTGSIENLKWLEKIDGAKLLSDVFRRVTNFRLEYSKTIHGPQIANRIPIEKLQPLVSHIERLQVAAQTEAAS